VRPVRPGIRRQFRPPRRGADGSSAWGGGLLFTGGGNFDASEFEMDCSGNAPCCCGHVGSLRRRWRPDCQRNKLHSSDQEQEVLGPLQQRRVPADGPRRQTREAQARVDEGHGYARWVRKVRASEHGSARASVCRLVLRGLPVERRSARPGESFSLQSHPEPSRMRWSLQAVHPCGARARPLGRRGWGGLAGDMRRVPVCRSPSVAASA